MGLETTTASSFRMSAIPGNFRPEQSTGFEVAPNCIRQLPDGQREHVLAFEISDGLRRFRFAQPGTFLDSFEPAAGAQRDFRGHRLGTPFLASADSTQWLRIWRVPSDGWTLEISGPEANPDSRTFRGSYSDLSLADLATKYPRGGTIAVRYAGPPTRVARFACRLIPVDVNLSESPTQIALAMVFAESVQQIELSLHELTSARSECKLVAEALGDNEAAQFQAAGLGKVRIGRTNSTATADPANAGATGVPVDSGETRPAAGELADEHLESRVVIQLEKAGWKPGLWLCTLRGRRAASDEWQELASPTGQQIALLHASPPPEPPINPVASALWQAWSASHEAPVPHLPFVQWQGNTERLVSLLKRAFVWRQHGFHPAVAGLFEWVPVLCAELCRSAEALSRTEDAEELVPQLLSLATGETGRDLFAEIPSLLALKTEAYSHAGSGGPIVEALAWCGRLAGNETVVAALREQTVFVDPCCLSCFANFAAVAAGNGVGELQGFNLGHYLSTVVGSLNDDLVAEDLDNQEVLGRAHARHAFASFHRRPRQGVLDGHALALASRAAEFKDWLVHELGPRAAIVGPGGWQAPWLQVRADLAADDLIPQFVSTFALAARCSARGWIEFKEALAWAAGHALDEATVRRAIASMVALAPELLGYHLMLWELLIRTYPHD